MPQIPTLCGDIQDIPSLFGRLSFVAELIDRPHEDSPACTRGRSMDDDQSTASMASLHRTLFIQWLSCPLEDRVNDLRAYFETQSDEKQTLIRQFRDASGLLRRLLPESPTIAEESLCASDIRLLIMVLQGSLTSQTADAQGGDSLSDWRIRALKARVSPHGAATQTTLKALCEDLRISARHLGRLFRRTTGVAFHRYLKGARLAKAADLLRTITLSVKEISAAVGYTSSSNFSRDFTSIAGISPTHYRDRFIEATSDSPLPKPSVMRLEH